MRYNFSDSPVNPVQFQSKDGYYEYPPEIWDAKKCAKVAKHWHRDGMGAKHPRQGYVGGSSGHYGYGRVRYNGGTVINDQWYQGVIRHLPKVAEGYKIVLVLTWGYYIVKENTPPTTITRRKKSATDEIFVDRLDISV